MKTKSDSLLAERLLAWFDVAKREMPWRNTRDPYAIWLSETMLQQTQVETVKPYYYKFLQRFPTVKSLAQGDLEEVLEMWAGLGYYRRARNMHEAAKAMVELHGGKVPETAAQLLTLKGVGRYTAGAVASIAFGERVPVLDGNVARVLARLRLIQEPINAPQTVKRLWVMAEKQLEAPTAAARPGDFNQGMMELGAMVCTPRNPQCLICPVAQLCKANLAGAQALVPVKSRPKAPKTRHKTTIILLDLATSRSFSLRFLLLKRPSGGLWESMWEFPTFANNEAQNPRGGEDSVLNWGSQMSDVVEEQLGLAAKFEAWRGAVVHQLTHRTMHVAIARGSVRGRRRTPTLPPCDLGDYQDFRWVTLEEMRGMAVARLTWRIAEEAGLVPT